MLTTELRQRALEAHRAEEQRQQTQENIANTSYLRRALKQVLDIDASPTCGEIEIDGLIFRGTADRLKLHLHLKMPDESWVYVTSLENLGVYLEKSEEMQAAAHPIPAPDAGERFAYDVHDTGAGLLQRAEGVCESEPMALFSRRAVAISDPAKERETAKC
jgi:hypothetical protein